MNRKGIILCAGNGSRLKPITIASSKHLLQVYDKPMVYYPLSVLMLAGVKEFLFITNHDHLEQYKILFGDGSHLGINIQYVCQDRPKGIADALIIGEEFLNNSPSVVILGDNLIYANSLEETLKKANERKEGATIFMQKVRSPKRFCVGIFNKKNQLIDLVEKPKNSISNLAVMGIYFFDNKASEYAKKISFSARGELEITDLNKIYLKKNQLNYEVFGRGFTWLDMGTFDSLIEAQSFVAVLQNKQGFKIACIEEISLYKNWIKDENINILSKRYKNEYGKYLKSLIKEKIS